VAAILWAGCASAPSPEGSRERGAVTARRGERWDISHAVEHYGLSRYGFEFGIGRHAIPPINEPDMSERGDSDHPSKSAAHEVIGFSTEGEVRSYPIRPLNRHEIVNESIGNIQAAVAY
jgi:hypothetical protein